MIISEDQLHVNPRVDYTRIENIERIDLQLLLDRRGGLLLLEQAGIMALAAPIGSGKRPSLMETLQAAALTTLRIAKLGVVKVALLALTLVPFFLLTVLTYGIFLSRHDINYYLENRPPVFWFAAAIGALIVLAALAAGLWLFVRWAFALPIVLFDSDFASSRPSTPPHCRR